MPGLIELMIDLEALESQDRLFGSLFAQSRMTGIRTILLFLVATALIIISLAKLLGDLEPVIKSPVHQSPENYKKKSLEEWEHHAKGHPDFDSPLLSRLRIISRLNLL